MKIQVLFLQPLEGPLLVKARVYVELISTGMCVLTWVRWKFKYLKTNAKICDKTHEAGTPLPLRAYLFRLHD